MQNNTSYKPVGVVFQFILIVTTSIIFALFVRHATFMFTSSDPHLELKKFTPKILNKFGGNSNIVSTGLVINDFLVFDPVKNDFIFKGTIWFEFDPTAILPATLGKFVIERSEILEKSEADVRIIHEKLFVRYDIKVRFKSQLNYALFPFDDHRIYLQITHPFMSPDEIIFDSSRSNLVVQASAASFGWRNVDHQVQTGYVETVIDKQDQQKNITHPSVLFSIDYARSSIRYASNILLPLLAIFFISLFIFSIDVSRYATSAITLSAGCVTGLLAYRFVIENLSPAVGYFMTSDYIFLAFLALVSLVFCFSILLPKIPHNFKVLALIIFHVVLYGILSILVHTFF